MDPIVHGLKRKYASCMTLERVNFHEWTSWHELIFPLASPEFALLDSSKQVLHRWFGVIEEEEFSVLLDPLCSSKKNIDPKDFASLGSIVYLEQPNHFARLEIQVYIVIRWSGGQAWHGAHLTQQWI